MAFLTMLVVRLATLFTVSSSVSWSIWRSRIQRQPTAVKAPYRLHSTFSYRFRRISRETDDHQTRSKYYDKTPTVDRINAASPMLKRLSGAHRRLVRLGRVLRYLSFAGDVRPPDAHAVGMLFRKWFYPALFQQVGKHTHFDGNHPALPAKDRLRQIGDSSTALPTRRNLRNQARQQGADRSRSTTLQAKNGSIVVGDGSCHCRLALPASVGGIQIGSSA
ncbi:MAG: hypothetical protein IPK19_10220 [Chloroflexi bacterium]|nr:hypothetical protein [Chloroflexota bacterium]